MGGDSDSLDRGTGSVTSHNDGGDIGLAHRDNQSLPNMTPELEQLLEPDYVLPHPAPLYHYSHCSEDLHTSSNHPLEFLLTKAPPDLSKTNRKIKLKLMAGKCCKDTEDQAKMKIDLYHRRRERQASDLNEALESGSMRMRQMDQDYSLRAVSPSVACIPLKAFSTFATLPGWTDYDHSNSHSTITSSRRLDGSYVSASASILPLSSPSPSPSASVRPLPSPTQSWM
jgi:hypothetical protein